MGVCEPWLNRSREGLVTILKSPNHIADTPGYLAINENPSLRIEELKGGMYQASINMGLPAILACNNTYLPWGSNTTDWTSKVTDLATEHWNAPGVWGMGGMVCPTNPGVPQRPLQVALHTSLHQHNYISIWFLRKENTAMRFSLSPRPRTFHVRNFSLAISITWSDGRAG